MSAAADHGFDKQSRPSAGQVTDLCHPAGLANSQHILTRTPELLTDDELRTGHLFVDRCQIRNISAMSISQPSALDLRYINKLPLLRHIKRHFAELRVSPYRQHIALSGSKFQPSKFSGLPVSSPRVSPRMEVTQ